MFIGNIFEYITTLFTTTYLSVPKLKIEKLSSMIFIIDK